MDVCADNCRDAFITGPGESLGLASHGLGESLGLAWSGRDAPRLPRCTGLAWLGESLGLACRWFSECMGLAELRSAGGTLHISDYKRAYAHMCIHVHTCAATFDGWPSECRAQR